MANEPDPKELMTLLSLFSEQQYSKMIPLAQAMTERFPMHGFGWKAWGTALMQIGKSAEALAPLQKSLALSPSDASAHNTLGNVLRDLGRMDEAETCYRQALLLNPEYAEAHNNLGVALEDMGRLDEAEASQRLAVKIRPNYVKALNNLASLLNVRRKPAALNVVKQSLQIEDTPEAKAIFVECLKLLKFSHVDQEMEALLIRALTEPWARPEDLAPICCHIVKNHPKIGSCIQLTASVGPEQPALFGPDGPPSHLTDPLLCVLLQTAPVCDVDLERVLTLARQAMLDAAIGVSDWANDTNDQTLDFYSALAQQCYINDYVFFYTTEEIRIAQQLRKSLEAALDAETRVPALVLLAVAAYFPLNSLTKANRLLQARYPEKTSTVLKQQIIEPVAELNLQNTIARLTKIEDQVSIKVQNQYEENTYPRWSVAAPAGTAQSVVGYLQQKFPLSSFTSPQITKPFSILIAGCGTGLHSAEMAQQFPEARILAIDLSARSLSYAKRKAQEMGLTSIEFAQADLLALPSLDLKFDAIDSTGVLHHLADPYAGWESLITLLKPNGIMRLGLYSQVARGEVIRIRQYIAERKYGSTAEAIRQCRQDLMGQDKIENVAGILNSADFYGISSCRDLLFHVQEHQMTLPAINAFLLKNNLEFLGFEIDSHILHAYKKRFPDDRAAINLDLWEIYERDNPHTFSGMYQFWVQQAA